MESEKKSVDVGWLNISYREENYRKFLWKDNFLLWLCKPLSVQGLERKKMGKSEDMWEKTTLIFTCNNKPESQEDVSKHSV